MTEEEQARGMIIGKSHTSNLLEERKGKMKLITTTENGRVDKLEAVLEPVGRDGWNSYPYPYIARAIIQTRLIPQAYIDEQGNIVIPPLYDCTEEQIREFTEKVERAQEELTALIDKYLAYDMMRQIRRKLENREGEE